VLIENFKVGGLAKFGLDYKSLAPDNPRLIYCSVTGFGQDGPYASRAGYDLMAQGMGGYMGLTGAADGEPMRIGVPASDLFTGVYSAVGILAALARREKTGRGGLSIPRWSILPSARLPTRRSITSCPARCRTASATRIRTLFPIRCFRSPTAKSSSPRPATTNSSKYAACWAHPNSPTIPLTKTTKGRLSRRAELVGRIAALTKKFKRAELLEKLEAVGVPAGPINDLEQVFSDPQVVHRGMRISRPSAAAKGGAIPGLRTPIMIDGAPMAAEHPSPRLGEHTDEILREIGEA
jgi:crotonobetainyl-CoA:carnitine CoA-transferase CaiB-like acyl-CoA transferase